MPVELKSETEHSLISFANLNKQLYLFATQTLVEMKEEFESHER